MPSLFILQREKELLRAVDYHKSLLEEARQKCVVEESKLLHLEEQINHAQKKVNRFPILLISAFISYFNNITYTYIYKFTTDHIIKTIIIIPF